MSIAKKIVFTVAMTFTIAATTASAQTSGYSAAKALFPKHHQVHHGYHAHYGGFGHRGYRHGYRGYVLPYSGIDYGFAARGAADLIRARSEANLTNAQAATQGEVARTERLKNDVFALETRLERKRINKVSRFGHLHARGAEAAQMKLASTLPQGMVPDQKRLGPDELEPSTGKVAWPLILAMSHFEDVRRPVDDVFAARAAAGSLHPDDYLPLLGLIDQVMEEIQINAAIFPKQDVADAQNFLRRMKAEARLPAMPVASASQLVSHQN